MPLGVSMYPTTPTQTIGGVSMMVTASTISFLLSFEPGRLASRTIWVMPALNPRKAVKWGFCAGSSFGKDFTFPRWRAARFLGKNPTDPWRGAENFRWDYIRKKYEFNTFQYLLFWAFNSSKYSKKSIFLWYDIRSRLTMLKVVNKKENGNSVRCQLNKLIHI